MKYLILFLVVLSGCDYINTAFTGCEKRDVKGTTCVVCAHTSSAGGVGISCDWGK